jgi:cytochrome c oxidase subunit IV
MMTQTIVSPRTYGKVFVALLILLALTVAAARIEHGALSLVAALSIAVAKATLIVWFFMQVRYESPVVRIAAAAGFVWLSFLVVLSITDLVTRP